MFAQRARRSEDVNHPLLDQNIHCRIELKVLIMLRMQEDDEDESDEEDDDDDEDDDEDDEGIEDMIAMDQGNHITIVELNDDGTEKADSDV